MSHAVSLTKPSEWKKIEALYPAALNAAFRKHSLSIGQYALMKIQNIILSTEHLSIHNIKEITRVLDDQGCVGISIPVEGYSRKFKIFIEGLYHEGKGVMMLYKYDRDDWKIRTTDLMGKYMGEFYKDTHLDKTTIAGLADVPKSIDNGDNAENFYPQLQRMLGNTDPDFRIITEDTEEKEDLS